MTTIIEIELENGEVIRGRADFGKGSPSNPMSDDELADKFRECADWGGLEPADAEQLIDLVWRLEDLSDVADLVKPLTRVKQTRLNLALVIRKVWDENV